MLEELVVGVVSVLMDIFDIVTFPLYYLLCRPWKSYAFKRRGQSRREIRNDCIIYSSLQEPIPKNIDMTQHGLDTILKMADYCFRKHRHRPCLGTREVFAEEKEIKDGKEMIKLVMGQYHWITYDETYKLAEHISRAFRRMGMETFDDKVAIFAETRAEWIITAYGLLMANIPLVTVYANLGEDGVVMALNETEVKVVVCSYDNLERMKRIAGSVPSVQAVVVMESPIPGKHITAQGFPEAVRVHRFDDFLHSADDDITLKPVSPPTPDDCAVIMYTSGTTGRPKGVMISQRNMVATVTGFVHICSWIDPPDIYLAYLPLAHCLELLAEFTAFFHGLRLGYSTPFTLTDRSPKVKPGCPGDTTVLKPSNMLCVPLVLERIQKNILEQIKQKGVLFEKLFSHLVQYKIRWFKRGFETPLLNNTVFRPFRKIFGEDMGYMVCGGAPISTATHEFMRAVMCHKIVFGYGTTESAACACMSHEDDLVPGHVGCPFIGVCLKLVNWEEGNYMITDRPYPRGELHIGGDVVTMGYYKMEELTKRDFYQDEAGMRWFKSGDIAEFYPNGTIAIIDRIKDLVKLQHGEFVSYGKVEAILKTNRYVQSICAYAEPTKDFIVAIIIPDNLLELTSSLSLEAACKDEKVRSAVLKELQDFGRAHGLVKYELPRKVLLTCDEWTPESGLVTGALKIRRKNIVQRYKFEINDMYAKD